MGVRAGRDWTVWPVHPAPLPDELLSSWMVRLAHLNGHKVHSFYALRFGKDWQIWNRDIDRLASRQLMEGLSSSSGVPVDRIAAATLPALEGRLFEHHNIHGNTKWILPLGIYHRTRRRFGLQYCPLCLGQDRDPYFRMSWRLAVSATCPRHRTLLNDRCLACGAPVVFSRADMSNRALMEDAQLRYCASCKADLASMSALPAFWPTNRDRRLALVWMHGIRTGWLWIGSRRRFHSILGYQVLHQVCRLLITDRADRGFPLEELAGRLGLNMVPATSPNFDEQTPQVRHALLTIAAWLLDDWPNRFITMAGQARLSSAWLLKDMRVPAPFWYASVVLDNFYAPNPAYRGSPPEHSRHESFLKLIATRSN